MFEIAGMGSDERKGSCAGDSAQEVHRIQDIKSEGKLREPFSKGWIGNRVRNESVSQGKKEDGGGGRGGGGDLGVGVFGTGARPGRKKA